MKRCLVLWIACLTVSDLAALTASAQELVQGIIDVKVSPDQKVEGYEKVQYWYTDHKKEKLYLHVKQGKAEQVLTDILVYNKGAGDSAAVGNPEGYKYLTHWDTEGSTDAFGRRNTFNLSLCVQYGTGDPVKDIVISGEKKGKGYELRGTWRGGGKSYSLYTKK